jgi:hypothetical protein
LANKLGAEHLLVVKSASLLQYQTQAPTALQHLVNDEVLDAQFTQMITGQPYTTWVLNKADFTIFEQGFDASQLAQNALRL